MLIRSYNLFEAAGDLRTPGTIVGYKPTTTEMAGTTETDINPHAKAQRARRAGSFPTYRLFFVNLQSE